MSTDTYLKDVSTYWQKGYDAPNVESFVFRPYGRIFKAELGIDGSKGEKLLDFGCGQGAALTFYKSKGFDVYGVDISEPDIQTAKEWMSDIKEHFQVIPSKPSQDDEFFGGAFDVIVSIQAMYYYTDTDMEIRLRSLYNQMKPGGIFYATMIGTKSWYFNHTTRAEDGLSKVDFKTDRLEVRDYYVNFTKSEDDLLKKFHMFEKIHMGYYDAKFREDEGSDFHYTFIGRKV